MTSTMSWLNEPDEWSIDGSTITAVTGLKTDFWRETFYGFVRDNGHFYAQPVTGDFTAEVTIAGTYNTLYDQSGLMLRVDERTWLKSGIEFTDGAVHVSTVVTRDYSDWSIVPLASFADRISMRLSRHGSSLRTHCRDGAGSWQLLRLAHLDMPQTVDVGVMCCSPERAGFRATFEDFRVGPAIVSDLHG